MADKRINALATTASSTASDDFIAVDGTTNGTRKLNAFSPTFGGNATVTGTLTVNGTSGSVIAGNADTSLQVGAAAPYQRAAIGLSRRLNYGDALFARNLQGKTASDNYTTVGTDSGSGYVGFEAQYGGVARILLGTGATTAGADVTPTVALSASTSAVSIPLTTASTSTSTGALVVGNGTSGGLGVGGAINAGGTITSTNGSGSGLLGMRSSSGNASYVFWSETGVADRGILGFNNGSSTLSYRSFSSSFSTGTEVFSISSAGNTTVAGTLTANGTGDSSFAGILRVNNGAIVASGASAPASGSGVELQHAGSIGRILAYNRTASSPQELTINHAGGNVTIGGTGTVTSILGTTASTSTSSGALVVSGGVGVAGKVNAGSFTTTGHTTSAVENVNVSTTAVDIAIATSVGAIYFVSGYNTSGGAQGTWLLMVRGSNVTTVSSDNNTGLTVTFSVSSGKLQAATASGTLVTNAYAITR